jgi:uncharacterized protein
MLEKGKDEFILTDYVNLQPLYVKKGKRYIKNFLKAASDMQTYKNILEVFPHDKDLLDTLLHHGIIVPYSFKRSEVQNYSPEGPDLHNKVSISLYLLISQSCNMGCVYCLNGRKTYQTDKSMRMDKEIAFKSIERCLVDIAPRGHLEVVFFGGEPMLNWSLAKEIITYCENSLRNKHPEKEIIYHITSNLSILPTDLIEWARKFHISFLCNIDGPAEIHDICRPFKDGRPSHGIIIRNIRRLVDAGLKVDLRATVTVLNQDSLLEITKHHKAIGGSSSAFIPVNPVNSDEDILAEKLLPSPQQILKGMIEIYRSGVWKAGEMYPFNLYAPRLRPGAMTVLGCGLPYCCTPVVDVCGDVYPCIYLVGIRRYYMGNIMNDSYPNRTLIKWMYDCLHVDHIVECKSCPWRYICGGGCPVWRLTVSDNPGVTDGIKGYCKEVACKNTKKIIEMLLWDKAQETASYFLENFGNETRNYTDVIHC